MPRPYVNVARNSVLTAPRCCNSSSAASTPSSTNETAPTWMPIVFFAGFAPVCADASGAAAACRKDRRVTSVSSMEVYLRDFNSKEGGNLPSLESITAAAYRLVDKRLEQ